MRTNEQSKVVSERLWTGSPDEGTVMTDRAGWQSSVRRRFFHFFNTLWLAMGLLAAAGIFLFPWIRPALQLVSAWLLVSFLFGLLLSKLGKEAAARAFLLVSAWLFPWALTLVLLPQFRAAEQQAALYGLLFALLAYPVVLSAALAGRWAGLATALANTFLLVLISRWVEWIAPVSIGLVLLWILLALAAWLYEEALREAQTSLQRSHFDGSLPPPADELDDEPAPEAISDLPLEGWEQALSFEDRETRMHGALLTEMTVRLAARLGITEPQLTAIRRGAMLHDIGKAAVPQHILHKPGPLTDEEREIVRRHPEAAREMLENHPELRGCIDIPYCHHERWDGTGYPRGLRGEEIPLAARIFAVVDVWNALRSDQPYRAAWSDEAVELYIRQQSGRQFDPYIAETFLELLRDLKMLKD